MNILRQVMCTLIVGFICMNLGVMYAWPSSTIQQFSSANGTLVRPMTDTEQALFGSLFSVTALISNPLSGFSLNYFGRRKSCILFTLPQVVSWAMISVSSQVEVVLAAVCVSGLGTGLLTIVPLYVSEISHETVRGTMTAGVNVFWGVGILVSYILGGYLTYDLMNYTNLTLSLVGLLMLTYIKESPIHLLNKGLEKEAAQSIAFYRSIEPESKEVLQELSVMRRARGPHVGGASPEEQKLCCESGRPKQLSLMKFLKNSKSTRRVFVLMTIMISCSLLQGLVVVQVYAKPMFEEAVPGMSGQTMSVQFAVACTLVGFLAAYLIDILGRRALLIYPSIAAGLSCLALGSQVQLRWGPSWLTAALLYCYGIACSVGAATVPYVYMAEIFLPEVSSILMMLVLQWAWVCNSVVLLVFNPLVALWGLGPIFYMFAAGCFATAAFTTLFVPETTALTVDIIQTLFVSKKSY